MDGSRKLASPDSRPEGRQLSLSATLGKVLDTLPDHRGVAVALSGGPDSAALAVMTARLASERGLPVHALHVHHGLYPEADDWARRAADLATQLHIDFHSSKVQVDLTDPAGIEAAARAARYASLSHMALAANISCVLLAHHLDDQVETVLLRLLRGAGPDGMSAMAASTSKQGVCYLRPWLSNRRSEILAFMREYSDQTGFQPVDDPSNLDEQFARGKLRTDVLPGIERHWPGYRATLERFARRSAESAALLQEIASGDLASIQHDRPPYGQGLSLSGLNALPTARRAMVLRLWLANHDLAAPSEARLREMMRQLENAAQDKQIVLRHGSVHVRRYRGSVIVDSIGKEPSASVESVEFVWAGEPSVRLESMGGLLVFNQAESGLDPQWLRAGVLTLRWRRGRERLRLLENAPSRSLKNLYQERGIPSWERERMPLLYRGDTLLYAAGLGADSRMPQTSPGVQLEWVADHPGATITL